jgi:phage-related tail protein
MKTEIQLNQEILALTMEIQVKFPELAKYITEMPVTIPDSNDPEVTIKKLQEYYDSLKDLVNKYSTSHGSTNI